MFAIEVQKTFTASHALRLPEGGAEPGHAHDFQVTVRIVAAHLDALQTVVDFHAVEKFVTGIVAPWQGRSLNDIEPFARTVNPSAERIAERIGKLLLAPLQSLEGEGDRGLRLVEVRVTEAPGCVGVWLAD
jgi:6-pyruvoyltetrahydropterin/6-carboxytetrahydropterin synthase